MTFGARLLVAMKAANLRAADISRLCDVSRTTVGRWMLMADADLAAKHAACISDATGADLRHLVTGNGGKKRARK